MVAANDESSTLHRRDAAHYNEEEDEEEILGSDDDEQEDPKDYCKGKEREKMELWSVSVCSCKKVFLMGILCLFPTFP